MEKVSLNLDEGIATLRLDNGVTNAISPALVEEVSAALETVRSEGRGLVLSGGEKFFSIGFDVPSLLQLDRNGLAEFFTNFNRVILDIYTLPMPTACAIAGHATGGGNIFALAGDYRFMGEGRKVIGLNEVNLGLPVPYLTDLILRQVVGDRVATEMQFCGDLLSVEQAQRVGLVDDVAPGAEVEEKVLEKVKAMAQKPRCGFSQIKEYRVEEIGRMYEEHGPGKNARFVETWFRPEVQELLKKAAEKF